MKKLVSVILAVIMVSSSVGAFAKAPSFLTNIIKNYTANYDLSISFDNSKEVVDLLNELEIPKEVEYYVDLEALLRTLLSYNSTMNVKVDMSDDYQKAKMSFVLDGDHNIAINPNLNIGIDSKMGMWINMDLSENNPVFDVIYQQPIMNKYLKISASDALYEQGVSDVFKMLFNKENIESMQKTYADLFVKYAKITGSGNKYSIKLDNDGFIAYINELFAMVTKMIPGYDLEIPSIAGVEVLGKDGVQIDVTLSGGKIKTEKIMADISINISEIYTAISGMEWEYESEGVIDFTVNMTANVKDIGETKVEFPNLTDENCIALEDMYNKSVYPEAEPEMPAYPNWYISESCDYLENIDGYIYVPLRQTIEAAYENNASIDYDNGKITLTSNYFNGYNTLVMEIDSDFAYLDNAEYEIMRPKLIDGKAYVSSSIFTELFGWSFTYAEYNMLNNAYHYTFYTVN